MLAESKGVGILSMDSAVKSCETFCALDNIINSSLICSLVLSPRGMFSRLLGFAFVICLYLHTYMLYVLYE